MAGTLVVEGGEPVVGGGIDVAGPAVLGCVVEGIAVAGDDVLDIKVVAPMVGGTGGEGGMTVDEGGCSVPCGACVVTTTVGVGVRGTVCSVVVTVARGRGVLVAAIPLSDTLVAIVAVEEIRTESLGVCWRSSMPQS